MKTFQHSRGRKLLCLGALSALLLQLPSTLAAQPQALPIDGYAAVINDRVVMLSDVAGIVQAVERQLQSVYAGQELEDKVREAYDSALQSLIDQALILEEFEQLGGKLPDRAVDDHINGIVSERFNNDRQALNEALTEDHLSYNDWRDQVKERLTVALLRKREVGGRVSITPRAIRETYEERIDEYSVPEEIRLHMIVLHKGESEADRAVKQREAEQTRLKLLEGADFSAVAKEVSEGGKAQDGGDWGWMQPSHLRSELSADAGALKPGDISDVIETDDAFYIMLVSARKDAGIKPFDEVRDDIEDELRQAEADRLYAAWIERLRKKHYVKKF